LLTAGCGDGGSDPGKGGDGSDAGSSGDGVSVLQHHMHATRDGVYVDGAFTRAAAANLHRDTSFDGRVHGQMYAQPLYVAGASAADDRFFVVTEENEVDALDNNGVVVWRKQRDVIGEPATSSALPCGNIDDTLGITGTPVIDAGSRTLFFDALTQTGGGGRKHLLWALALDDGSTRAGYPIDVAALAGDQFDSSIQSQRGALVIVGGSVYVPYGGMAGDCGDYRGWVVGVPIANPDGAQTWHTDALESGIWAPGGLASDGTSVFAATGNGRIGSTQPGHAESVLRFDAGPRYADIFTAHDWAALDRGDTDIGGSGPLLVDAGGKHLAVALAKSGKAYLLDRDNLGSKGSGSADGLAVTSVAKGVIINAAAAYSTGGHTFVVFKGSCKNASGTLQAFQIGGGPSIDLGGGWCADHKGGGSPMVTMTDAGGSEAIVWAVGTESGSGGGDGRLHGFAGESGAAVFSGGGDAEKMGTVRRFSTAMVARGRIFVAGDDRLYAFTP
jgi:hypothetical protein